MHKCELLSIHNKRFTKVNEKEDDMRNKYMMDVHDVMNELGVSRSKAYQILRELNHTLEQPQ